MSPVFVHGRLQLYIGMALITWADATGSGRVASEWRFRIAPPGQIVRPLVPDVAYLSFEALPRDAPAEAYQVPLGAPTIAVEIVSPDDRARDVGDKISTYLSAESTAVFVVDPTTVTITVHDRDGRTVLGSDGELTHRSLPGFRLAVGALFERSKA